MKPCFEQYSGPPLYETLFEQYSVYVIFTWHVLEIASGNFCYLIHIFIRCEVGEHGCSGCSSHIMQEYDLKLDLVRRDGMKVQT